MEYWYEDPRGFRISLNEQWYLEHIQENHPEILRSDIQGCLEAPDYIFKSEKHPEKREVYFAHSSTTHPKDYVATVVQKMTVKEYKVITAHLQENIDGGIHYSTSDDILYRKIT